MSKKDVLKWLTITFFSIIVFYIFKIEQDKFVLALFLFSLGGGLRKKICISNFVMLSKGLDDQQVSDHDSRPLGIYL